METMKETRTLVRLFLVAVASLFLHTTSAEAIELVHMTKYQFNHGSTYDSIETDNFQSIEIAINTETGNGWVNAVTNDGTGISYLYRDGELMQVGIEGQGVHTAQ